MDDFERVYRTYSLDVYKYLLALSGNADLSQELTQETFFSALKSFHSFRGECKIQVWLCQIAKHAYYASLKKDKRTASLEELDDLPATEHDPFEFVAEESSALKVHRLLHELQEPYKEVFMLRIFGELSFRKISDLFGRTENWARVTFYRAKLKIAEQMEET